LTNKLVNFEVSHADTILEEPLNKGAPAIGDYWRSLSNELIKADTSFTAIVDDKPIACGGIYPIWTGVGEAWFLGSYHLHDHSISIARLVRNNIEILMKRHNLHRAQATIHSNFNEAYRFATWLGFDSEGVMKAFSTDKQDYFRFAKVIL